jgi:hypothetical protein
MDVLQNSPLGWYLGMRFELFWVLNSNLIACKISTVWWIIQIFLSTDQLAKCSFLLTVPLIHIYHFLNKAAHLSTSEECKINNKKTYIYFDVRGNSKNKCLVGNSITNIAP